MFRRKAFDSLILGAIQTARMHGTWIIVSAGVGTAFSWGWFINVLGWRSEL